MPRCSHADWLAAGTVSGASAKGANAGRTARAAARDRLRGDSTTFLLWRDSQHVTPRAADRARGERGHGHDRGGGATDNGPPAPPPKSSPTQNRHPTSLPLPPPPYPRPPPANPRALPLPPPPPRFL